MNVIETLYRNTGFITVDDYVKIRDGLWVKSGPYKRQSWNDADKSILPSKEELHEIYLKFQELIQIQEACGLPSLKQILDSPYLWIWSSTEYSADFAWEQRISDGTQYYTSKALNIWVVPVRRTP